MLRTYTRYYLIKTVPLAVIFVYLGLCLLSYTFGDLIPSSYEWLLPWGYGLCALIVGDPLRRWLGVTYKWLAAYTRSLGAVYITMAFALAFL